MAADETQYTAVDVATLKAGMLVERPLYVFLSGNGRYILLAKPLHPLEERVLVKFQKLGQVFSTQPAIEVSIPQLGESTRAVRELCDDAGIAPFEKNKAIRSMTEWLSQKVLKPEPDTMAALFFFHRAFGVPKPETLVYLSDLSLVMYERSLKLAAISGLIALWLGYSDTTFLSQFVETVFCEEVGLFQEGAGETPAEPAHRLNDRAVGEIAIEMMGSGLIPGVAAADHRFQARMKAGSDSQLGGDELYSIVELARWLAAGRPLTELAPLAGCRVLRKLQCQFGVDFGGSPREAVAA